jgi:hypothetical protein
VAKFLMKLAAANLRPGMAIARNVAGLTVRHSAPTRGSKRRTSNGLPGNRWSEPMRPVMVDFFSAADAAQMSPVPGKASFVRSPLAPWKGTRRSIRINTSLLLPGHSGLKSEIICRKMPNTHLTLMTPELYHTCRFMSEWSGSGLVKKPYAFR